MSKIIIIVMLIVALFIIPYVKEIYDGIYETVIPALGITLSPFEEMFLKLLPLVVPAIVVFGLIYKLFKRGDTTGQGQGQ